MKYFTKPHGQTGQTAGKPGRSEYIQFMYFIK